jgi:hypothetical protein
VQWLVLYYDLKKLHAQNGHAISSGGGRRSNRSTARNTPVQSPNARDDRKHDGGRGGQSPSFLGKKSRPLRRTYTPSSSSSSPDPYTSSPSPSPQHQLPSLAVSISSSSSFSSSSRLTLFTDKIATFVSGLFSAFQPPEDPFSFAPSSSRASIMQMSNSLIFTDEKEAPGNNQFAENALRVPQRHILAKYMQIAWKLLDHAPAQEGVQAGRISAMLRLHIALRLADVGKMSAPYKTLIMGDGSELEDSELSVCMQVAPTLGKWNDTVVLGKLINNIDPSMWTDLGHDGHIWRPNYRAVYDITCGLSDMEPCPLNLLRFTRYKVVHLSKAACPHDSEAHTSQLDWADSPCDNSFMLLSGGVAQMTAFCSDSILNGIALPMGEIRMKASRVCGELPDAQMRQEETCSLQYKRRGRDGQYLHYKGIYTLTQDPITPAEAPIPLTGHLDAKRSTITQQQEQMPRRVLLRFHVELKLQKLHF